MVDNLAAGSRLVVVDKHLLHSHLVVVAVEEENLLALDSDILHCCQIEELRTFVGRIVMVDMGMRLVVMVPIVCSLEACLARHLEGMGLALLLLG